MEITYEEGWSLAPIGELLFLEQAWQGYREHYTAMTGDILWDVPSQRIRFFHLLRRTIEARLAAQKS